MSTVRIQVRRGTASDWTSVNPTLAAGEVGFDTTSNKIKVGDGSTAWSSLGYISSDAPAIGEIAQDAIAQALTAGSGLDKVYDDAANTITLTNTGVLSFNSRTGAISLSSGDISNALGYTAADAADLSGLASQTGTDISDAISTAEGYTDAQITAATGNIEDYADTVAATAEQNAKTYAEQYVSDQFVDFTAGSPTFDGSVTAAGFTTTGDISAQDVTVGGNLYVTGTTTTTDSQTLNISDPLIYLAADNEANIVDIGFVGSFTDSNGYQHTGLAKDATDGYWKFFKGVTTEPGSTVDFENGTLDNLKVNGLIANLAAIGDVTNTQIQYLKNVSADINDSLNSKASLAGTVTFTGSVTLPADSIKALQIENSAVTTNKINNLAVTSGKIANAAIDSDKIADNAILQKHLSDNSVGTDEINGLSVTTAKIANEAITTAKVADLNITNAKLADNAINDAKISAISQSKITNLTSDLALKANLDAPTFTGTVILPSTTSIGNVSATEIGYVDGVTSSIQTQIDTKASSSTVSSHISATTSVHGIADTAALATKTYVDNAGSSLQTNIDAKAPIASPTFTGTVSGITKAMIGLSNVDNTSDTNKPVSTATQTALDLKAALSGPTFTGTVVLPSTTSIGNVSATEIGYVDGVTSSIQTQLNAKAPVASPTFTGTTTVTDLVVSGTTTTVNATNLEISDPLIYVGTGNSANASDLGIVGHFNNGTYQHTGLIRDHADGKWKLFSGVTTEPGSSTIDLTGAIYDTFKAGALEATSATIGNVSNTELQYLDGVTSAIQTQMDAKAPKASPTFTGTVTVSSSGITFSDGTVQTVAATPSLTPINPQTASVTLGASFVKDSFVKMNVSSANTVTIPTDATYNYPIGASLDFQQAGTGQTSFVAASGVTFEAASVNGSAALKFRGQFSVATALKVAANTWAIFGDLTI